jgi:hypothetical protein
MTLDDIERCFSEAITGLLELKQAHLAAGKKEHAARVHRAFFHFRRAWALSVWAERVRLVEEEPWDLERRRSSEDIPEEELFEGDTYVGEDEPTIEMRRHG